MWIVDELLTDTSAHLTAALLDWHYPLSQEGILLAQTLDFHASANPKNKPIPKPWKQGKRTGRTSLDQDSARVVLARMAGRG